MSLLAEARMADLTVMVEGGRLVVRGPRRAETIARRLTGKLFDLGKWLPWPGREGTCPQRGYGQETCS